MGSVKQRLVYDSMSVQVVRGRECGLIDEADTIRRHSDTSADVPRHSHKRLESHRCTVRDVGPWKVCLISAVDVPVEQLAMMMTPAATATTTATTVPASTTATTTTSKSTASTICHCKLKQHKTQGTNVCALQPT